MLENADAGNYKCNDEQTAIINEYCESIYNANERKIGLNFNNALSKAFDW